MINIIRDLNFLRIGFTELKIILHVFYMFKVYTETNQYSSWRTKI